MKNQELGIVKEKSDYGTYNRVKDLIMVWRLHEESRTWNREREIWLWNLQSCKRNLIMAGASWRKEFGIVNEKPDYGKTP